MAGISEKIKSLLDLTEKVSGMNVSFASVLASTNALSIQFLQLKQRMGDLGGGSKELQEKVFGLSRAFGYSQQSMIQFSEIMGTGFRKPITDIEAMTNVLTRLRTVFGANEQAAVGMVSRLAEMENRADSLRDSLTPLLELMGKKERGLASPEDLANLESYNEVTRAGLETRLAMGMIDLKTYNSTMALITAREKQGEIETKNQKSLLVLQEQVNKGQAAAIAQTELQFRTIQLDAEGIGAAMGLAVTGGSQVVASGIEYISSMVKGLKDKNSNEPLLKLFDDDLGKQALDKFYEEAKAKAGLGANSDQIKQQMASLLQASGVDSNLASQMLSEYEKLNGVKIKMTRADAESAKYADLQKKAAEGTLSVEEKATLNQIELNNAKGVELRKVATIRQDYEFINQLLERQNAAVSKIYTGMAASGKGFDYRALAEDASKYYNTLKDQEMRAQQEVEVMRKRVADQSSTYDNATPEAKAQAKKDLDLAMAGLKEAEARVAEIQSSALSRADAVNKYAEKKVSLLQSELGLQQELINLQDSLAVGIGASAASREKAAQTALKQAQAQREAVQALEVEIKQAKAQGAEQGIINELIAKQQDARAKEVSLQKQALDMMQKMREGYLEAIDAMQSGAGMFTEIIVDQNRNLGTLIQTTGEVPRVLGTGAGSGGITSSTQFGPGGITGGMAPKSEEYSKHVLSNFDQINSLVADLPKQIGDSVGNKVGEKLALGAKDRPEFEGQIMGAATPGSAGTLSSGAGKAEVEAKKAEDRTRSSKAQAENATKRAAETTGSAAGGATVASELSKFSASFIDNIKSIDDSIKNIANKENKEEVITVFNELKNTFKESFEKKVAAGKAGDTAAFEQAQASQLRAAKAIEEMAIKLKPKEAFVKVEKEYIKYEEMRPIQSAKTDESQAKAMEDMAKVYQAAQSSGREEDYNLQSKYFEESLQKLNAMEVALNKQLEGKARTAIGGYQDKEAQAVAAALYEVRAELKASIAQQSDGEISTNQLLGRINDLNKILQDKVGKELVKVKEKTTVEQSASEFAAEQVAKASKAARAAKAQASPATGEPDVKVVDEVQADVQIKPKVSVDKASVAASTREELATATSDEVVSDTPIVARSKIQISPYIEKSQFEKSVEDELVKYYTQVYAAKGKFKSSANISPSASIDVDDLENSIKAKLNEIVLKNVDTNALVEAIVKANPNVTLDVNKVKSAVEKSFNEASIPTVNIDKYVNASVKAKIAVEVDEKQLNDVAKSKLAEISERTIKSDESVKAVAQLLIDAKIPENQLQKVAKAEMLKLAGMSIDSGVVVNSLVSLLPEASLIEGGLLNAVDSALKNAAQSPVESSVVVAAIASVIPQFKIDAASIEKSLRLAASDLYVKDIPVGEIASANFSVNTKAQADLAQIKSAVEQALSGISSIEIKSSQLATAIIDVSTKPNLKKEDVSSAIVKEVESSKDISVRAKKMAELAIEAVPSAKINVEELESSIREELVSMTIGQIDMDKLVDVGMSISAKPKADQDQIKASVLQAFNDINLAPIHADKVADVIVKTNPSIVIDYDVIKNAVKREIDRVLNATVDAGNMARASLSIDPLVEVNEGTILPAIINAMAKFSDSTFDTKQKLKAIAKLELSGVSIEDSDIENAVDSELQKLTSKSLNSKTLISAISKIDPQFEIISDKIQPAIDFAFSKYGANVFTTDKFISAIAKVSPIIEANEAIIQKSVKDSMEGIALTEVDTEKTVSAIVKINESVKVDELKLKKAINDEISAIVANPINIDKVASAIIQVEPLAELSIEKVKSAIRSSLTENLYIDAEKAANAIVKIEAFANLDKDKLNASIQDSFNKNLVNNFDIEKVAQALVKINPNAIILEQDIKAAIASKSDSMNIIEIDLGVIADAYFEAKPLLKGSSLEEAKNKVKEVFSAKGTIDVPTDLVVNAFFETLPQTEAKIESLEKALNDSMQSIKNENISSSAVVKAIVKFIPEAEEITDSTLESVINAELQKAAQKSIKSDVYLKAIAEIEPEAVVSKDLLEMAIKEATSSQLQAPFNVGDIARAIVGVVPEADIDINALYASIHEVFSSIPIKEENVGDIARATIGIVPNIVIDPEKVKNKILEIAPSTDLGTVDAKFMVNAMVGVSPLIREISESDLTLAVQSEMNKYSSEPLDVQSIVKAYAKIDLVPKLLENEFENAVKASVNEIASKTNISSETSAKAFINIIPKAQIQNVSISGDAIAEMKNIKYPDIDSGVNVVANMGVDPRVILDSALVRSAAEKTFNESRLVELNAGNIVSAIMGSDVKVKIDMTEDQLGSLVSAAILEVAQSEISVDKLIRASVNVDPAANLDINRLRSAVENTMSLSANSPIDLSNIAVEVLFALNPNLIFDPDVVKSNIQSKLEQIKLPDISVADMLVVGVRPAIEANVDTQELYARLRDSVIKTKVPELDVDKDFSVKMDAMPIANLDPKKLSIAIEKSYEEFKNSNFNTDILLKGIFDVYPEARSKEKELMYAIQDSIESSANKEIRPIDIDKRASVKFGVDTQPVYSEEKDRKKIAEELRKLYNKEVDAGNLGTVRYTPATVPLFRPEEISASSKEAIKRYENINLDVGKIGNALMKSDIVAQVDPGEISKAVKSSLVEAVMENIDVGEIASASVGIKADSYINKDETKQKMIDFMKNQSFDAIDSQAIVKAFVSVVQEPKLANVDLNKLVDDQLKEKSKLEIATNASFKALSKISPSFSTDVNEFKIKASESLDEIDIGSIKTDKIAKILVKNRILLDELDSLKSNIDSSVQDQVNDIQFPEVKSSSTIPAVFNLALSVAQIGIEAIEGSVKEEMSKFAGTTIGIGDLVVAQFGIKPEAVINDIDAFNRSTYGVVKEAYSGSIDVGELGKAVVGVKTEARVDPAQMKSAVENAIVNTERVKGIVGDVADGYFGVKPQASVKGGAVNDAVNEAMTIAIPQSSFTKDIMLSLNPVIDAESTRENISSSMTVALQKIGGVNVSGNIPIAPVSAGAAQQQVSLSPEVLTQMMSSLVNLKNISSIGSGPSVNVQQNMGGENSNINISNIKVNVDDMVTKIAGDIKSGMVSAVKQGITAAIQELANNT